MHPHELKQLRERLLAWFDQHGRNYPWRETSDPYRILVAEVLLHRTRAEQVVPVYEKFIRRFPDPESLARAERGEVMKILHPLGLHWRSALIHEMAREIVRRGGVIQPDPEWLRSLPGVSDYIAGAVLSFAFRKPAPILDTNTVRILARLHGLPVTDGSRRSRKFRQLYEELMDPGHPDRFNQAMLDLGALVCRPTGPRCGECPLAQWCSYHRNQMVHGRHIHA